MSNKVHAHLSKSLVWLFSCVFCLFTSSIVIGQHFSQQGDSIPDFTKSRVQLSSTMIVDSLPISIDNDFGLTEVCVSIEHNRVSDLKVELRAPDGSIIWLTNRNGENGSNYLNTCFNDIGFDGNIFNGKSPFTGTYVPDGRISSINNGQNPNGIWKLIIHDLLPGVTGRLVKWHLTFDSNPPYLALGSCSKENGIGCTCLGQDSACELLPDLILSKKMTLEHIREYPRNHKHYRRQIRLSVAIANIGAGPLEIQGSPFWFCGNDTVSSSMRCSDGKYSRNLQYQKVYIVDTPNLKFKTYQAGFSYYDDNPGHDHYHYDDWVLMSLREKGTSRNPLKWPMVASSSKVSFCLFDNGYCNEQNQLCMQDSILYTAKNLANFGLGEYLDCESAIQGISVGGYDHYGHNYEGQFITLPADLCNGQYWLVLQVNPSQNIKESNYSNNVLTLPVEIKLQNNCY